MFKSLTASDMISYWTPMSDSCFKSLAWPNANLMIIRSPSELRPLLETWDSVYPTDTTAGPFRMAGTGRPQLLNPGDVTSTN